MTNAQKCKYCGRPMEVDKYINHLKEHLGEYEEKEKDYHELVQEIRTQINNL